MIRQRRLRTVSVAFLAATLSLASAFPRQDKVVLAVKGQEGQVARYTGRLSVSLDFMGQMAKLDIEETSKVTVGTVGVDGTVTFERKTEAMKQTLNGEELPSEGTGDETTTSVVRPDGTLVDYKSTGADEDAAGLGPRLYVAQSVVFSKEAVGVGSKWSHTYAADAKLKTRAAKADFELLAMEEAMGVACAKVKFSYAEEGAQGVKSAVTAWVEVASGDVVKSEVSIENVPFPGPSGDIFASAKGTSERTEGGPLPGNPAGEAGDEAKPKTIDEVTKGYEKIPGFLTFYKKREAGRDTVYMEVGTKQIGRLMMLQATAATGTSEQLIAGDPIADIVFKFEELQADKLTMVVPNFSFRAADTKPIDRAVERSFAESMLEQFDIEARQPDRESVLIDVSELFRGDIARIQSRFQGSQSPFAAFGGGGSYSLDREKTYVEAYKSFPTNVVVQTMYSFMGSGGPSMADLGGPTTVPDSRNLAVRVVYNLFALPVDNGYVPRLFDKRVGYFTVAYQDFTNDRAVDQTKQYVLRWDLRKKDPTATVSEPVQPIVFWIDNAVPNEYRDSVRDALLSWNQAFEAAGFKDAVVVKQMPDDADFDPSDMRYNVVRWVASSGSAYAIALFRTNPITGQILNASITVDANIVRAFASEHVSIVDPASSRPHGHSAACASDCRAAEDGMLMARVGHLAVQALRGTPYAIDEQEYIKQFVRWVVTHEMGHILGLRHNFVASTELSLAELGDRSLVDSAGTSASVMDYVAFNPSALRKKDVAFYGPSIGKYDVWAVTYGYTPFGAASPSAERAKLQAIAQRTNEPGLKYLSDEDADGWDPYVTRFDLSAKPIEYWTRMLDLTRSLIGTLGFRRPTPGESYYSFTRDFGMLVAMHGQAASQLTRYVGALRKSPNHKGDPGQTDPLVPIPGPEQAAAVKALTTGVLSEGAFNFPKSYYTKFTANPNTASFLEAFMDGQDSFPVLDTISGLQRGVLSSLLAADTLQRVANNEFKVEERSKPLSMPSLFATVTDTVWSELETGRPVGALRRNLQRANLDLMLTYAIRPPGGLPADARMLAWHTLRTLKTRIAASKSQPGDEYTPVHLAESSMRIDRALNAMETIGGSQPAGPSLLEQLLGGTKKGG
jgi:hypothetical protein